MSVGFVSAGGGRYYTDLAREDYYLSGGESPGEWHDNGAARRFGLSGVVERHHLENLFDGYDPEGSKRLVQNAGDEKRRAAVDLCFSAPKDFSTLWAVADEEERKRLEAAFHRAVDKTLEYVNDECGWTRRGQGGYDREKVDLLVAKYTHRSSRAQEPQFHCHALCMNVCERADGTFGTVDAGPMLSLKKVSGAYFRSALASELGVPLERDPNARFSFRIPGTPGKLSDEWSTRSKEVQAEIKEQGTDGARAKALAALSTRQVKGHRALGELRGDWASQAAAHDFSARDVEKVLSTKRQELTPQERTKLVDSAIGAGVTDLTRQEAHFSKHHLLRDVCVATVDKGIDPKLIRERVDQALKQERFVELDPERGRFTTRHIYEAIEGKALATAKEMSDSTSRTVPDRKLNRAFADCPQELNAGQRDATTKIVKGPDLVTVQGPPGSGKTTMLRVARDAIERGGGDVIGLCPTNRAARELKDGSGIRSYTLDKFLYDQEKGVTDSAKHHARMLAREAMGLSTWKQPKIEVGRRTTIVVDECSMADNEKLAKVLDCAHKKGCRVVLIGDQRQLPAIGQGGLFREVHDRMKPEAKGELTEIVRQKDAWARSAIQAFGRGEIKEAMKEYEARGFVSVSENRDEAMGRLVGAWSERGLSNPKDHLMLASTNAEVNALNDMAQKTRLAAGELGWKSVTVGGEKIFENDRVLFTETKKQLGIINSEFGTVTAVDQRRMRLTVQVDGADQPVTFSLAQFDGLKRGYAATVHRAQGMTLDQNSYILFGGTMQSREMTYVQISRARGDTFLFTDKATTSELGDIERQAARSVEKTAAHTVSREAQKPGMTQELRLSL